MTLKLFFFLNTTITFFSVLTFLIPNSKTEYIIEYIFTLKSNFERVIYDL